MRDPWNGGAKDPNNRFFRTEEKEILERTRQTPRVISLHGIERLGLVLTGQCNLDCSYCYQDRKQNRRMDRRTLEASIDLALGSHRPDVELIFTGGEPLLERESIEYALRYAERDEPGDNRLKYLLLTNGLLLDREVLELLVAHDVRVQLSFDGLSPAQDLRGRGTFPILSERISNIRQDHPTFFEQNLSITSTVTPSAVFSLASSVDYFLSEQVREIKVAPVITHCEDWDEDLHSELERQFDHITRSSLAHYRETGEIPFFLFRGGTTSPGERPDAMTMCGVMRGSTLSVDVDGMVYGCVAFIESIVHRDSGLMERSLTPLRMGHLLEPGLDDRHARFQLRGLDTAVFNDKQEKHTSYRECGECPYLADCAVCPISIGNIPGNEDPNRIPDFQCAFNYAALTYRDRFQGDLTKMRKRPDRDWIPVWRKRQSHEDIPSLE